MRKAAWEVVAATICGVPVPPRARYSSRAASTASRQDSVPPLVTTPAVCGPPPSRPAAMPTTPFSSAATDGKTVGSRQFTGAKARCARAATSSRSASPLSYT